MSEEQTKPKRHYYARHHDYGIDTLIENSDRTIERFPGTIMRFACRKVRDAWVDDEIWMALSVVRRCQRAILDAPCSPLSVAVPPHVGTLPRNSRTVGAMKYLVAIDGVTGVQA